MLYSISSYVVTAFAGAPIILIVVGTAIIVDVLVYGVRMIPQRMTAVGAKEQIEILALFTVLRGPVLCPFK